MSAIADRLLKEILQLPPEERVALADQVYESLDDINKDESYEAAWEEEIRKRIEDYETGRVKGIPWEEAMKQISAEEDIAD
jgi:putative addiction module component (TIGR02574 family)